VRRISQQAGLRSEKAEYFFYEAQWYRDQGKHDKAVQLIRRAIKLDPKNIAAMKELANLGHQLNDAAIELDGLLWLYRCDQLEDHHLPAYNNLLSTGEEFGLALVASDRLLERLPKIRFTNKRRLHAELQRIREYCRYRLESRQIDTAPTKPAGSRAKRQEPKKENDTAKAPSRLFKPKAASEKIPFTVVRLSFHYIISQGFDKLIRICSLSTFTSATICTCYALCVSQIARSAPRQMLMRNRRGHA
jgi:tetratricopeptide (TPR) repeat protein